MPLGKVSARAAACLGMTAVATAWTLCALPCIYVVVLLRRCRLGVSGRTIRRLNWGYGRVMLFLMRPWLPVRIRDAARPKGHAPGVLVCNHQSFLDLFLLAAQDEADLCLMARHWPFRLYFFAPAMLAAGFIDAESLPGEAVAALAKERLKEGAMLVVFPEGHRSRTGRLGRFHAGAFRIAVEADVPVFPLVIRDSFAVCPPGRLFLDPSPVHMVCLAPVHPRDFRHEPLPHRAMMRHVRALFVQNLNEAGVGR